MSVIHIGKCIGCNKMGALEGSVGRCCLRDPNRGEQWAHTASQVRESMDFAKSVYSSIETLEGKNLFVELFGLPPGEVEPLIAQMIQNGE